MSATFRLPPSGRDFDVFFDVMLQTLSTRQAAANYKISQSRVRQLVVLVADWLAEHLPDASEGDLKKQVRLAQHIAAGRLEHQYEQAMRFWNTDRDPKHLRQATRIALAQARLGVVAGRLHALAADALEGPLQLDSVQPDSVQPEAPVANNPSVEDCSPAAEQSAKDAWPAHDDFAASDCQPKPDERQVQDDKVHLEGVAIIERRLLTLIADQGGDNPSKVAELQSTLAGVRREKAKLELRLSKVGISLREFDGDPYPRAVETLPVAANELR